MRKLILVVLILVVAVVAVYIGAGSAAGPTIKIASPAKYVGLSTPFDVVVSSPGAKLSSVEVAFEQQGTRTPIVTLQGAAIDKDTHVSKEGADSIHIKGLLGRETIKGLRAGQGRIVVNAVRPVFGMRQIPASAAQDVEVRFERPKLAVASTHHYINSGGAEMIIYRVTPADVASGVAVGDLEYPGYPAAGLDVGGVSITDPTIHIAFFALKYDQNVNARIHLYARDPAGNTATADFDHLTFPRPVKTSRIPLDDAFLERVVPAILGETTEIQAGGSTIESFLKINGDLRKLNAAKIASFASQSAPQMLWQGVPFHPFTNTKVEAAFADRRTYIYKGKEVDKQTHLGFDLASVANTPVVASNRGKVLFADMLGIYGNCVIIDHGMGVQSLYAHLSSIDVKPGAMVEKEQAIGRSGKTGLAAGDHLHFTMLVNGQMVNPIEWWDPHWIADRVLRKLHEVK